MIKSSAIKAQWKIFTWKRHGDCFVKIVKSGIKRVFAEEVQWFVDEEWNFLTREEALVVARENNQIIKGHNPHSILFSEDIFE